MVKNNDFHQIRQVELTTNQLLLAQACVSSALVEMVDFIKKMEENKTDVKQWEIDDARNKVDELKLLAKAFRSAMADIESTWGEEVDN